MNALPPATPAVYVRPAPLSRVRAGPDPSEPGGGDPGGPEGEGGVVVRERIRTKKPPMFKVLIHNDDYTTMEFVVWILMTVFRQSEAQAVNIMLHVHRTGIGVAGVYTRQIAESKRQKVVNLSRQHDFPLQCTLEEA